MIGPQLPNRLKRKRDCDNDEEEPSLKRKKLNESKENELMHPRNIYRYNKPNYYELSLKYKFFADVLKQNNLTGQYYINYADTKSNIMLTKVLLKHDFNLEFEHPMNHLCPPITQRLNYILWIQDLLQCINKINNKTYYGFDIGVGASCIFPLLGIKIGDQQNELWSFIASDIDTESIQFANKNIKINDLNNKIRVIQQTNPQHIFKGIIDDLQEFKRKDNILFDFTVCNPPFFEDLQETALNKSRANNATKSELVYENGGEVGFIKLIIDEINELQLHDKINWFTTMLGKKTSIKSIKTILNKQCKEKEILIVTKEFFQGKQVRWGLAWTFNIDIKHKYNLLYSLSSHTPKQTKHEFLFDLMVSCNTNDYNQCLMDKIDILLKKYGIKYDGNLQLMYNESNNKWIEINDIKNNGFVFGMKWIIKPNQNDNTNNAQKNKIRLSIIMSFCYHKGDNQLFNGFVEWFHKSVDKVSGVLT